MAPPQVDLNKKPPVDENWAEKVGLPPQLPPIKTACVSPSVSVEEGKHCCGKKRRCKKIVIGVVITVVILAAIAIPAGVALCRRRHGRERWESDVENDGYYGRENVQTDGTRQLVYVARNASNHFFAMDAVLDFGTQLAGFRDNGARRCYVDRLRESYEDGCRRWREYQENPREPGGRPLRVVQPPMQPEVSNYICGRAITDLCMGIPTFWVVEVLPRPEDGDMMYPPPPQQPPTPAPSANGDDIIFL